MYYDIRGVQLLKDDEVVFYDDEIESLAVGKISKIENDRITLVDQSGYECMKKFYPHELVVVEF